MVDAQLNINLFDGIVYLTLFLAGAISLYRGFIREFLSLLTWFGGGLITLSLADNAIAFIKQYMTSNVGAAIVGVLGTYFLTIIVLGMLSRVLMRYIKDGSDVGWVDNALGLFFGLIKGGLVIVLGFILMTLIFKEEGYPEWVQTASTLPAVQSASIGVVRMMPEYLGTISSLSEPTDDELAKQEAIENGEVPTADGVADSIEQELLGGQKLSEEQVKQGTSALEQLIKDVTKNRPEPKDDLAF